MNIKQFWRFFQNSLEYCEDFNKKNFRLYKRYSTAYLRMDPQFMLIGVEKCGTSSLTYYLMRHRQIKRPIEKETNFFDQNYELGYEWYRCFFPFKFSKLFKESTAEEQTKTFEATSGYIFHPEVPERIKKFLPKSKFLCLFRNPVRRAYSDFYFRLGGTVPARTPEGEKMTFERAIHREQKRLPSPENIDNIEDLEPDARISCLTQGLYYFYLKHWLKYFPKDCFKVVKSENMFEKTNQTLNGIADFLGIEPSFGDENYEVMNRGGYPPMRKETGHRLREWYRPFNRKLYELIGRDLEWESEI